jgi:hypothetical protein
MEKDDFYKLVERLSEVNKSLESSFKYQIITILAFYLILNELSGKIEFAGLEIQREAFITIFPIMLLYFLSKACVLTTLFIELYEKFYLYIGNQDSEIEKELIVFRIPTIFLCLPLTRFPKGREKRVYRFHFILSSIVYFLPGISLGLIIYYFFYQIFIYKFLMFVIFFILLLIPIGILYHEFVNGRTTSKYKYLIRVAIIVSIISALAIHLNKPKLFEKGILNSISELPVKLDK